MFCMWTTRDTVLCAQSGDCSSPLDPTRRELQTRRIHVVEMPVVVFTGLCVLTVLTEPYPLHQTAANRIACMTHQRTRVLVSLRMYLCSVYDHIFVG